MPNDAPVAEEPLLADDQSTTSWVEARRQLEQADTYWLATVNRDCRPHVVPLLAVWSNGALHFVASEESHKARNLARNATCVITTRGEGLDLVIEGHATKVREEARLRRVAEAYAAKYDWQVDVRNAAFYADGAPTAGPPPYDVYQVIPAIAFGFGQDESFSPTRWRFSRGSAWPQGAPTS